MAKSNGRPHPFTVKLTEAAHGAVRARLAGDQLSPRQEFFFWVFRQWLEIDGTLDRLQPAFSF